MHTYTSPVCSSLPKALGEKQKEICIFFFLLFCSNKKIAKDSDCFKKRRRRRIYAWETNIFKQATQGLGLTELFGSHWNKVGHLMSRSSISQLLIRSSKHRKATSRAPKRHNHCAQNAGARKLLNYLKCQRNSLEKNMRSYAKHRQTAV